MASLTATPNPGIVGKPIAILGEGFANSTECVVEVVGPGVKSEITSSAAGAFSSAGLADHATVTLTSTGQPSTSETLTLGTQVYTLRSGTNTLLPNEIRIGAAATDTLDNIKAAVNNGAGEGVTYGLGTPKNNDVFAGPKTATTIVFYARQPGTVGNSIVSTETLTTNAFGAGTLTGGAAALAKPLDWTPTEEGTYRVTATDGTNSASVDVRVFTS
jgi:hypothetical protein